MSINWYKCELSKNPHNRIACCRSTNRNQIRTYYVNTTAHNTYLIIYNTIGIDI